MKIKEFYHKDSATFSYILADESTKKAAVIDPVLDYDHFLGKISYESADKVISYVKDNNFDIQWILETHIHADHLSSMKYLKEKFPDAKTAISSGVIDVLKYWKKAFDDDETKDDGSQFDKLFDDGEKFKIGDIEVEVIDAKGHTPSCICFKTQDKIFVGDVIFMPDIGTARTDFPGGSAEESYESIQKIFNLGDNVEIYTAHDYPPQDRGLRFMATVETQKKRNIIANSNISREEFIEIRQRRDRNKPNPKLLYPSIQFNMRAGEFYKDKNGNDFVKLLIL